MTINSNHWPSPYEMANRNVKLNVIYGNQQIRFVTRSIKAHVTKTPPHANKVIVYSNQHTKIVNCAEKLEHMFDEDNDLCNHDVLTLVGTLTKQEKAQFINSFLDENQSILDIASEFESNLDQPGLSTPSPAQRHQNKN